MTYIFSFAVNLSDDEDPNELLDYFEQSIQENLGDISAIQSATVKPQ
jgi:hypothetical protein